MSTSRYALRNATHQDGNVVPGAIEAPPRGLYSCKECGESFQGPAAASLWINHICSPQRRSAFQEAKRARARQDAREMNLLRAAREVIDFYGYQYLIEALGREFEHKEEEARVNSDQLNEDTWHQRASAMFAIADVGEVHEDQ